MRLNRTCEMQDGGLKTGSNDILACRQVNSEIPTAVHLVTCISRVQHSNGTNDSTVGFNRKCEIQDGGHKTGSNDIAARRQDSDESVTARNVFDFDICLAATILELSDFRLHYT